MIKINLEQVYWGPSIYSSEPVVLLEVTAENIDSKAISAGLVTMGKIFAESVSLPKQNKNETDLQYICRYLVDWSFAIINKNGFIHSSGSITKNKKTLVWLGFHNAKVSTNCIILARDILLELASKQLTHQEAIKKTNNFLEKTSTSYPDFQARILMKAANSRDIPYMNFSLPVRNWQYGWGSKSRIYFDSISEKDSAIGRWIVGDKHANKIFMHKLGVPIVNHLLVPNLANINKITSTVGFPCVVKPIDLGQARGVTVNISTVEELKQAYSKARKLSKAQNIMVESYIEGDVHRLLVIEGKLIAATRRSPAIITGDGKNTLIDLAKEFNKKRMASAISGDGVGPAPFDSEFDIVIAKQGFSRTSVPPKGKKVHLRSIPLQGSGADNIDVTDIVNPNTKFLVESLAKSVGLNIVGYDFITEDISVSCHEKGAFIEMNSCPSLRGHMKNGVDTRNVASHALGFSIGRIPSVLIVSDDMSHNDYKKELASAPTLGWRFADGVGIGGCLYSKIDPSNHIKTAVSLISNKGVEKLLLVCSPDELMKFGMPLDKVDHVITKKDIDPDWKEVLHKHSKTHAELKENFKLSDIIKKHLS